MDEQTIRALNLLICKTDLQILPPRALVTALVDTYELGQSDAATACGLSASKLSRAVSNAGGRPGEERQAQEGLGVLCRNARRTLSIVEDLGFDKLSDEEITRVLRGSRSKNLRRRVGIWLSAEPENLRRGVELARVVLGKG